MLAIVVLLAYLALGMALASCLFPRWGAMGRAYVGSVLGLTALMWLPCLWAFAWGFGFAAQAAALVSFALAVAGALGWTQRRHSLALRPPAWTREDTLLLVAGVPLGIIVGALLVTHVLLPQDGALMCGQSTFGDLCLHLGISSNLAVTGQFPPEYSIYPGARLSYPFLADTLTASLMLWGMSLRWAFIVPGALMGALVGIGVARLARQVCGSWRAALLALAIFLVGGGFGIWYFLDGAKADPGTFSRIFSGFYTTPTNLTEQNIRWVNPICDLLVPQRTLLAGWTLAFLVLQLLHEGARDHQPGRMLLAGLLMGALPMIHTHSYMAVGLIALGWAASYAPWGKPRAAWGGWVRRWMLFGAPALALSLPQLFFWTFGQAESFVKFHFNWVNQQDPYLWFYIKNLGLVALLLIPAWFWGRKRFGAVLVGPALVWLVAELWLFQPNSYDNNKLLWIAYAFFAMLIASYLITLWRRLGRMRGRGALVVAAALLLFSSGALSLAREAVSQYQLFSADAVRAADYIAQSTPGDALFLTGGNHNNAVSTLAGRTVYCGTNTYLFFHGIDTQQRRDQVRAIYQQQPGYERLMAQIGADYLYVSSYEVNEFGADIVALSDVYPMAFYSGDCFVLAVSERARALLA